MMCLLCVRWSVAQWVTVGDLVEAGSPFLL